MPVGRQLLRVELPAAPLVVAAEVACDRRLPVPRIAVERRAMTRARPANLVGDHEPLERAMNVGVERADRPEPVRVPQPLEAIGRAGTLIQPTVVPETNPLRALRGLVRNELPPALLDRQPPPPLRSGVDHRSS